MATALVVVEKEKEKEQEKKEGGKGRARGATAGQEREAEKGGMGEGDRRRQEETGEREGFFDEIQKTKRQTGERRGDREVVAWMIRMGNSLLPGGRPSQQLESWLRVPGEDDVPWGAKNPVAQHHLEVKGKPGGDLEESLEVGVGQAFVDDYKVVRVEDNQGKEVANEVFSQAWLAAETTSHSHRIKFVFINEVGAEGTIGFSPLEILFGFLEGLWNRWLLSSLFGGGVSVEVGSLSGVNLLF